MVKDMYRLANHVQTAEGNDAAFKKEKLEDSVKNKYEQSVLSAIRRDKRRIRRKRLQAAAACLAVLTGATVCFHEEVGAAIRHIRYSLRAAMGLQSDLAGYKEVVHTSVSDGGYKVTLEEAAAAPGKLALSYTVQREDGRPMSYGFEDQYYKGPETCFALSSRLFINGAETVESQTHAMDFLDADEKTIGGRISYVISDTDLSCENTYDLKLHTDKGNWNFRFLADGTDMYASTKRMDLDNSFLLPDGTVLTLDELSVNDLEQRIKLHTSKKEALAPYAVTLHAVDEQGRTTVFYTSSEDDSSYIMNAREDSFLSKDAKAVTVSMYLAEFEKYGSETENGQVYKADREVQIPSADGGAVVWDLKKLRQQTEQK